MLFHSIGSNNIFLALSVVATFWVLTIINLRGIKLSAWFSNFCTITGLILPMALIIGLGISWVTSGNHIAINLNLHDMLPSFNEPNVGILTAVIL